MSGSVVHVKDVTRTYNTGKGEVHALRGINLGLEPGRLIALRGRSGSGKTTLLNLMGGLDKPTEGKVVLFDRDISDLSEKELTEIRRHEIGFIFQSFALMPIYSALENVELPLHIMRIAARERAKRAKECLDRVGLGKRMTHRILEMSGGEQQRVAIARAIVHRPKVIFADEPTGELDTATGLRILKLFRDIVLEQNVTICLTTHDPAVMEFCDITYAIQDGRIVGEVDE